MAETFGKRHDHVLRDIDKLVSDSPNLGSEYLLNQIIKMIVIKNSDVKESNIRKLNNAGEKIANETALSSDGIIVLYVMSILRKMG